MNKFWIKKKDEQETFLWSGGKSTFIDVPLKDGIYEEYNLELTSSTMEKEETCYTKFENHKSLLMIIDGETTLTVEGKHKELKRFDIISFDRKSEVTSHGIATDYEIMMRNDCQATLEKLENDCSIVIGKSQQTPIYIGIYSLEGKTSIKIDDEELTLDVGDQFSFLADLPQQKEIFVTTKGIAIKSEVMF